MGRRTRARQQLASAKQHREDILTRTKILRERVNSLLSGMGTEPRRQIYSYKLQASIDALADQLVANGLIDRAQYNHDTLENLLVKMGHDVQEKKAA